MAFLINNYEIITAFSSILIATLAFFLTFYESHLNRKHDRLSVKPKLSLGTRINDALGEGKISADITLQNNGLGPACSNEYVMKYNNGTLFANKNDDEEMKNVIVVFEEEFSEHENERTVSVIGPDTWIPAGEKIVLFGVGIATEDAATRDRFKSLFRKLKVQMTYESIYGDGFSCDNQASLNQIR